MKIVIKSLSLITTLSLLCLLSGCDLNEKQEQKNAKFNKGKFEIIVDTEDSFNGCYPEGRVLCSGALGGCPEGWGECRWEEGWGNVCSVPIYLMLPCLAFELGNMVDGDVVPLQNGLVYITAPAIEGAEEVVRTNCLGLDFSGFYENGEPLFSHARILIGNIGCNNREPNGELTWFPLNGRDVRGSNNCVVVSNLGWSSICDLFRTFETCSTRCL